jgi:hypothetical protein
MRRSGLAHSTAGGTRIVTILAGLSLALNLLAGGAYVGSTYFASHMARPSLIDRRFADLARNLGVDLQGDPGIAALHRAVKVALDVRHIRTQPLFGDIMAEFAKPAPDPARIQALQDAVTRIRRETGDETLAALIAFLDQATPDEREKLLGFLKDRKNEDTAPIRFGLAP